MTDKNIIVGTRNDLHSFLEKHLPNIGGLPIHIEPQRMINFALTALSGNKALTNCTRDSFMKAFIESICLGLEPNTPLEQAYLIPYGDQVKLILGYQGLITLAYQSGIVATIKAVAVFGCDEFTWDEGKDDLNHIPDLKNEERTDKNIVYVYCKYRLRGAENYPVYVVMTRQEVDLVMAKAKTKKIWNEFYAEMAKKTVVKRAMKMLPKSADKPVQMLAQAVSLDNAAESGERQQFMAEFEDMDKQASPEPKEEWNLDDEPEG